MHEYIVYILRCADDTLYIGMTSDLPLRLYQHEFGAFPDCYTVKRRPAHLVYTAVFEDVHDAIAWERRLKRWSRRKKEALIAGKWGNVQEFAKGCFARYIDTICVMVRRAHHDNLCHTELSSRARRGSEG
jgi:putative endonuclease